MIVRKRWWLPAVLFAAAAVVLFSSTDVQAQGRCGGCCRGGGMQKSQGMGMPGMGSPQSSMMMLSAMQQQNYMNGFAQQQSLQSQTAWKSDLQQHHEANLAIDRQQRQLYRQLNPQASDTQKLERK